MSQFENCMDQKICQKYCTTGRWDGEPTDLDGFKSWVASLGSQMEEFKPNFATIFWTPDYFDYSADFCEELQLHLKIPVVTGCSSSGLLLDDREYEGGRGVTVSLHHLPDTEIKSMVIEPELMKKAVDGNFWRNQTPFDPGKVNSFLIWADPMTFDSEKWLKSWGETFQNRPAFGGLAAGVASPELRVQLYLNGRLIENGGVVIGFEGPVGLRGLTSQGCLPIGEPRPITRSHQHVIEQIGNRPAFKVLAETLKQIPPEEQVLLKGNLFMGLAFNEYQESFREGDFLIRNLMEADPVSGNLVVAANFRPGQTIQFQKRDSTTASRELQTLLERLKLEIGDKVTHGAILCSCLGRGSGLFEKDNHDTSMIVDALGDIGINGFFANGEIGPVSGQNFLHGFSATLGVFCSQGN